MLHLRVFNSIKLGLSATAKYGTLQKQVIPSFFIHSQSLVKREASQIANEEPGVLPIEILRKKAHEVETKASLRSRCRWSKEETEKLMKLVEEKGPRWSDISKEFIDRSPSNVYNHYRLKTQNHVHGSWKPEEIEIVKEAGKGRTYNQITNWEEIHAKLPSRPLFLIKQLYKHTLDPSIKHGRWTEEESDKLRELVLKYGEKNMNMVADLMGSRTKRQCLERWRWQMTTSVKGRFTDEENRLIMEAVEKYGENFAVICKVTGIPRTPRHVSQHYATILSPNTDRSDWTNEEQKLVYETCLENNRDMVKTKEDLKSNRAIRDMWNKFHKERRRRLQDEATLKLETNKQ